MDIKNVFKGVAKALPLIAIIAIIAFGSVTAYHAAVDDRSAANGPIVYSDIERPRKANMKAHRVSKQDVQCLATNIYHEARNQSEQGMMGVAFVTINRTKTVGFPSSVCDVVYERTKNLCQFSWVCEKKNKAVKEDTAFDQALAVAKRALYAYNHMTDPTGGALFYHATYVNPHWKNLVKTIRIDDHIFYK